MTFRSSVTAGPGRRKAWRAPNGTTVVLPLTVRVWRTDPLTGEPVMTVTAVVSLVDRRPQTTSIQIEAPDGLRTELLQRDFRWATPADIVTTWVPQVLAEGRDPLAEEPPSDWWTSAERQELSDAFLRDIAQQYLALGRGYTAVLAAKYQTTPRTVRSWIEKARERGLLGAAPKRGKTGAL